MKSMIKQSGYALLLAGICFAIPNTIILPYVDFSADFSELMLSQSFLYRMIFAALTVAFLIFGSVGIQLYHHKVDRSRLFRTISFLLAFFGSAIMFCNEWHQIFVIPDIANISPETVDQMAADQTGRYGIGAMIALGSFSLGWILYCISILTSKAMKSLGPLLVLIGFFTIPLVSGLTSPVIGGISGSVLLGLGFILMSLELIKSK